VDSSEVFESLAGGWASECKLEDRRGATEGVGGGINTDWVALRGLPPWFFASLRGLPLGLFASDTALAVDGVGEFGCFSSGTGKENK
jgi:hypothetical protein